MNCTDLCFLAEREQRNQQHATELEEKDKQIAELRKELGQTDRELRGLQGTHYRTKNSLECTARLLRELQAEEKE